MPSVTGTPVMQPKRAPDEQRRAALQLVFGEAGCSTLVFILLAAGAGMLLDFQVTGLHPFFSIGAMILAVPAALLWTLHRLSKQTALKAVAGQAGCITVVLVFAGMFVGMFLDSRLDTHPVFSIGLALISVPISLYRLVSQSYLRRDFDVLGGVG